MIESVTDAVPLVLFIALVFLDGMKTKVKAKASAEGKAQRLVTARGVRPLLFSL